MLMNEEQLTNVPFLEVVPKTAKPTPNVFNPESWKAMDFKTKPNKKTSRKTKTVQKSNDDDDDYIEWGAVCKVDASAILEGVAVSAERLGIPKETNRCFRVDHRDQASAIANMFNISSSAAEFESAKQRMDHPSTSPHKIAGTPAQPSEVLRVGSLIQPLEPTEASHTKNVDRNQAAADQPTTSPNKSVGTTAQPAENRQEEPEKLSHAAGGAEPMSDSGTKAAADQRSTSPHKIAGTPAQPAEIQHLEPTEASHTKNGDRNQAAADQPTTSPNKSVGTTAQPAENRQEEPEKLSHAAGGAEPMSDSGTKAAADQRSTSPHKIAGTPAQPAEIQPLEPTEASHTKNGDRNQAAADQPTTSPNKLVGTMAQPAENRQEEPEKLSHAAGGAEPMSDSGTKAAADQRSTSPHKIAGTPAQPAEIQPLEPTEPSHTKNGDRNQAAADQPSTSPNKLARQHQSTTATDRLNTDNTYVGKFAALIQRHNQPEVDGDHRINMPEIKVESSPSPVKRVKREGPEIKVEPARPSVKRKRFFQQVTEAVKKRAKNSNHSPESDSDCEVARGIVREMQDDASRKRNADCTDVAGNVHSDDEQVPCLMLRDSLLGELRKHHHIVQSYRLKRLPMKIHVITCTKDASSTLHVGHCTVTECHELQYGYQLPKECDQSSQWREKLRKKEKLYMWMVDELHELDEPIKLRLTYQKFRNRHFCMSRTALFESLRVVPPQELSLFHTSWFFLNMLSSSDRERLKATAEKLNGCTLKVGTTCSGTDISVTAMKSIIKMMNREFQVGLYNVCT